MFHALTSHADVCETPHNVIAGWVHSKRTCFKQHLPPTPHNVEGVVRAIRPGLGVLLLTRHANEALHAECERWVSEGKSDKINASQLPTRLLALQRWTDGWRAAAARFPQQIMEITYEEMQEAPGAREAALRRTLAFWRLPVTRVTPFVDIHLRYVNKTRPMCNDTMHVQAADGASVVYVPGRR